jgi:hypothetical protein
LTALLLALAWLLVLVRESRSRCLPEPPINAAVAAAGSCSCSCSWLLLASSQKSVFFAWLISHQPVVLFSQNKLATSQQYSSVRRDRRPTEQAAPALLAPVLIRSHRRCRAPLVLVHVGCGREHLVPRPRMAASVCACAAVAGCGVGPACAQLLAVVASCPDS